MNREVQRAGTALVKKIVQALRTIATPRRTPPYCKSRIVRFCRNWYRFLHYLTHDWQVVMANSSNYFLCRVTTAIRWYFPPNIKSLLLVPLFLWLVYCFLLTVFGALLKILGFFVATKAVYGALGIVVLLLASALVFMLVVAPPACWFMILMNLPYFLTHANLSLAARLFIASILLLILPFIASGFYHTTTNMIGWIAQQDPCAAWNAGIMFTTPPLDGC